MRVTDNVHLVRIPFRLGTEDRFVNAYVILGRQLCLIDSGPLNGPSLISDHIKSIGRSLQDISMVINTHAHADHIGGNAEIKRTAKTLLAAHTLDVEWIRNINKQYVERPVPGFYSLVKEPTEIDICLNDNDVLDLGTGVELRVIHSPGHSPGSICLYNEKEHTLFSGDAVPVPEGVGMYSDFKASLDSLKRLARLPSIDYLLSSWHEPTRNGTQFIAESTDHLAFVHSTVARSLTKKAKTAEEITREVFFKLGVKPECITPLRILTVKAHLKALLSEGRALKTEKNRKCLWMIS